jgi:hypothetical protein
LGKNRERNRRYHKNDGRPSGCAGQRGCGAAGTERRLATLASESGSDIAALAALQQDDDDKEKANNDVNNCKENDHAMPITRPVARSSFSNENKVGSERGI